MTRNRGNPMNKYKNIIKTLLQTVVMLAITSLAIQNSPAQTTAFAYQGRLNISGSPANGIYDFTFQAFDAVTAGNNFGGVVAVNAIGVTNGLFTALVDLGATPFTGPARWLQITVRTSGGGAYTTLLPREQITPTPYAIYSANAGTLGGQSGSAYVAKSGDTMTGSLNLPANGLTLAGNQLVASSGNVGIGTLNPQYPLVVRGGSRPFAWERYVSGVQSGKTWAWEVDGAGTYLRNATDVTLPLTILNGGNVGIGTINPEGTLSLYSPGSDLIFKLEDRRTATTGDFLSKQAFYDYGGEAAYIGLRHNFYLGSAPRAIVFGLSGSEKMRIANDGKVGIGTTSPDAALHVINPTGFNLPGIHLEQPAGFDFAQFRMNVTGFPYWAMAVSSGAAPSLNFNTSAANRMSLGYDGTLQVQVLQINGADVAEPFELSTKDIPKGSVVIIDEENPGRLKLSDHAYDKRVAGILSGANGVRSGISLKQQGFNDGGENVALSGRVYAFADASYGGIKPGDMLTTSQTPGHCMKVKNQGKDQGSIIGKAMSSLPKGKGMVLVLVTLQ